MEIKLYPKIKNLSSSQEQIPDNVVSIGAETFWSNGYKGKNVTVAILDTGCNPNHYDLKDRIIGGYNFTSEFNSNPGNIEDLNGHGTHVAGVIGASLNQMGLVGVAPEVNLLILKVLNEAGEGSIENLINAIDYAINWQGPNNETVDVISMSLGFGKENDKLHHLIKKAINNNIPVVAAAGNEGDGDINTIEYSYPAKYEEVISVGALKDNNVARFSNTNDQVDLYAPGFLINSTYLPSDNPFYKMSGTSMATPHVTGALALLINKYQSLCGCKPTEQQLFNCLMQHTTKVHLAEYQKDIQVLDLSKNVIEDKQQKEDSINMELLMKCYCETRKSQAFFTKCLEKHTSETEKSLLLDLVEDSVKSANNIKKNIEK